MSEELEARLAALETKPDVVKRSGALMKWIQSIIALIIIVFGVGANYAMTKSHVTALETQVANIEKEQDKEESLWRAETDKLKEEVVTLRLKGAGNDQWRETTTETLAEIKTAIVELTKKRSR